MYWFVTEVAWWPTIKTDIYNHWLYCSLCISKRNAKQLSGLGTLIRFRHRHISGDHVILPKWLADIVGYAAMGGSRAAMVNF